MAGGDNFGTDGRQISQTPSSSGGTGGIFGNASAAIGDVGVGTSAAEVGDTTFNTRRDFNFSGPVVNRDNNQQLIILGAFVLGGFFLAKKMKVI